MSGGGVRLEEAYVLRSMFVVGNFVDLCTISGDGVRLCCCILAASGDYSGVLPPELEKIETRFLGGRLTCLCVLESLVFRLLKVGADDDSANAIKMHVRALQNH